MAASLQSSAPVDRRISVVVRYRDYKNFKNDPTTWRLENGNTVLDNSAALYNNGNGGGGSSSSSAPPPLYNSPQWTFDRVYGPATNTHEIFQESVKDIVHSSLEGINGTIFAYGQTASGKTFTMHGDQENHGVIPYTVHEMFRIMDSRPDHEYLMSVSYLEIYNENMIDLLSSSEGGRQGGAQQVKLFDRPDGSLDIRGLSETRIANGAGEVFDCLVGEFYSMGVFGVVICIEWGALWIFHLYFCFEFI